MRYIEGMISTLPSKTRRAFELAWRSDGTATYAPLVDELSQLEDGQVQAVAMRQRVSRAARFLEDAIHHHDWHQTYASVRSLKR